MRLVSRVLALGAVTFASVVALNSAVHAQGSYQFAQIAPGGTIADIRVEGNQRIEPATVLSYLAVRPGDPFDPDRVDQSLKALFATGLFADVTLKREGSALVVSVAENPIINRIAFEGNKRIEDEELNTEVQLRPRVVYTRTRVQSDVQRILDLYRRKGRFAATVEPKVIQLDQNRVDLVFEVDEGPKTTVSQITFIGNEHYSDSRLREEINTKESAWYRFLSASDTYDPDRTNYDRELLRRFYLSHGYADFRVVSAVAELAPERDSFFITFTVEEGERYKFGKIDLQSTLKDLDLEVLRDVVTTETGDWYNAEEVDNTITKLTNALGEMQYAFVDIKPRIQRNRENSTIDITFDINEGPRVFVERIEIQGNVRTLDKVVRREMLVAEGDPFNAAKLRRSESRVRDLGYFEKVQVTTQDGTSQDRTVVNVEVQETATGEISLGGGYSTVDGALADFGIRERNLLGRGQDLRFATTLSQRRQEYDISFTEPYFLDRDLAAGVDLFRITRDNQRESSFDESNTGFSLRLGYPLTDRLRQRLNYTLESTEIENVASNASRFISEQEGQRLTSLIGQEIMYDRRDSRLSPTEGYYVRLNNELAGLGGDAKFLRNRLGAGIYVPVAEQWILGLSSELGYILGLGQDVHIADRFFLGGDTLRGFKVAGIGPRDIAAPRQDALGGTRYVRGSAELSFPLGLPEEMGFSGHLFSDAGSLWESEVTPGAGEILRDENSLRLSVGAGLGWRSPLGPIRIDLALPIVKEDYDKVQQFRFSFGTRF